jgi:hypothetical protein
MSTEEKAERHRKASAEHYARYVLCSLCLHDFIGLIGFIADTPTRNKARISEKRRLQVAGKQYYSATFFGNN